MKTIKVESMAVGSTETVREYRITCPECKRKGIWRREPIVALTEFIEHYEYMMHRPPVDWAGDHLIVAIKLLRIEFNKSIATDPSKKGRVPTTPTPTGKKGTK
jgi:hypothetical protein